jgi:hypothetical protein
MPTNDGTWVGDHPAPVLQPDGSAARVPAHLQPRMTDRSMTGREFVREAGDDPAKWAEALYEATSQPTGTHSREDRIEYLTQWLSDYAEAVRKAKPAPVVEE